MSGYPPGDDDRGKEKLSIVERRQLKAYAEESQTHQISTPQRYGSKRIGRSQKPLPPLPSIAENPTRSPNEPFERRLPSRGLSSTSIGNLLKGVKRVASFGKSVKFKKPREEQSHHSPTERGTQTDPVVLDIVGSTEVERGNSLHSGPQQKVSTKRPKRERADRNNMMSLQSILQKGPTEDSVTGGLAQPSNRSTVPTASDFSGKTRAINLSLVGPFPGKDRSMAARSVNTLGTYESRYSEIDSPRKAKAVKQRTINDPDPDPDSELHVTPKVSHREIPMEQEKPTSWEAWYSEHNRSSDSSDDDPKRRVHYAALTPGGAEIVKAHTQRRGSSSFNSSQASSFRSPLRQEIRFYEMSPPASPMRSLGGNHPWQDYFDYPGTPAAESPSKVPDHLPASMLCPLHPKHPGGQEMFCPFHTKDSHTGANQDDGEVDEDNPSRDSSSLRMQEDDRESVPDWAPDHRASDPLCPANSKILGARAFCAIHGRRIIHKEDSEDSSLQVAVF